LSLMRPDVAGTFVIDAPNDAYSAINAVIMVANLSNGNVGIGTTNPAKPLHVSGGAYGGTISVVDSYDVVTIENDDHVRLKFHSPNNKAQYITFADPEDTEMGYIEYSHSLDRLQFNVNKSSALTILGNGNVGIGTTTPASTLTITGNFSATGTKSAVVNTTYGIRKLYAMESPDIRFYDEGRARLSNGIANISLDPIFIETVEPEYNVHLTPEGKTLGIYVDEKAKEYFIVKSYVPSSNIAFTWQISAIRKGYKDVRLDLERKEDLEIIAVIDEQNKVTDVEISRNVVNENNSIINKSLISITGNVINEESDKINEKITINSGDEDEVIKEIEEKTKLDKDKIKKSITFRRKEPVSEILGEPEIAFLQPQLTRITEINGSIIMRLG